MFRHWKKVLLVVLVLFVIYSYGPSFYPNRKFPAELGESKTITYKWEYGGAEYSITDTFYKNIYDFYAPNRNKEYLEGESFEHFWSDFLPETKKDSTKTISRIASAIKQEGEKNNLTNDEIVELTVSFVQSIPYDDLKAGFIEGTGEITSSEGILKASPRFPYEVLYENMGVCSGKTYLMLFLVQELGYGVAVFEFPETKDSTGHVVPAIKCPLEYDSYDSGYCFTETTEEGYKIGQISEFDTDTGKATTKQALSLFGEQFNTRNNLVSLQNVEIYEVSDGYVYSGVIETLETLAMIEKLDNEINKLDKLLSRAELRIKELEQELFSYEQRADNAYARHKILKDKLSFNEYKRLFSLYEDKFDAYELALNNFNNDVSMQNKLVNEYNALIEEFYR